MPFAFDFGEFGAFYLFYFLLFFWDCGDLPNDLRERGWIRHIFTIEQHNFAGICDHFRWTDLDNGWICMERERAGERERMMSEFAPKRLNFNFNKVQSLGISYDALQHCFSLLTHNFQGQIRGYGLLAIYLQHNIFSLTAKNAIVLKACGIENQLRLRVIGAVLLLKLQRGKLNCISLSKAG